MSTLFTLYLIVSYVYENQLIAHCVEDDGGQSAVCSTWHGQLFTHARLHTDTIIIQNIYLNCNKKLPKYLGW